MADINKNSFAVITGASSGIGFELARQFAENGFDILVTSGTDSIHEAAEKLRLAIPGVSVSAFKADLTHAQGVDDLWRAIRAAGRPLDAIAINAGIGVGGAFADNDLARELEMIALNVTATTHVAKHAVQAMRAQGHGRILFTASVVSVMPAPYQAVYGATKAYVLSLSEALRNELKDTGVTVTALMPGATETNFFHRAGLEDTKVGQAKKDDPADVARDGFKALMDGEDAVIAHSVKTKAMGFMNELLPETLKAEMHRRQAEPGSAKH